VGGCSAQGLPNLLTRGQHARYARNGRRACPSIHSESMPAISTTSPSYTMPGSSLWLLPPPSHPLSAILPTLIAQTSEHFHSPRRFLPHVTLTSEIPASAYGSDPQAWLDALELPCLGSVEVRFEQLGSENVFVRKLYIKCAKSEGLKQLAKHCRQKVQGYGEDDQARAWVDERYNPHLSLL